MRWKRNYFGKKNDTEWFIKQLDCGSRYIVSKYLRNNTPLNVHLILYADDILVLPASVQIVELDSSYLLYKGGDYIAFKYLEEEYKTAFYNCAYELGVVLQKLGYRGICGVDALVDSESKRLFLIEVNPRFQGSSYILDKALTDYGYDCLAKMNYDAFLYRNRNHTNINLDNFSVNYSCYSLQNSCQKGRFMKEEIINHKHKCIDHEYDGFDVNQQLEKNVYLSKMIFAESIYKRQWIGKSETTKI